MAEEISWEEIKQMFRDTDAKFKETDAKFKETDAKFKETDKRIKQAFELFESQWGKLIESLVEGDLVRVLNERDIAIHRTSTRVKGKYGDTDYEFDIIAHNGNEIVVTEVKTTLRSKHVKTFLQQLEQVKTWMSEYTNHKVYGAVAFLHSEQESERMAEKRGLFVIRATGDSAAIVNDPDFRPKAF